MSAAAVEASYAECRRITRRSASNFFYTFYLLPAEQRRAMHALYAFLRVTDDLADDAQPIAAQRERIARWRQSLDRALAGEFDSPLWPALAHVVARFQVPPVHLHAVIDGVEMDLNHDGFETFADLQTYCEHVASAVGLACIHIWGFRDAAALEPARKLGIALQLTNILRDLKEDAARGRIYLPREDLRRFGYSAADLTAGLCDERFERLLRFQIDRAEAYYREGEQVTAYLDTHGRSVCGAMTAIYRRLLAEIRRRNGDVLTRRVQVSAWRKLALTLTWLVPRGGGACRAPAGSPPP